MLPGLSRWFVFGWLLFVRRPCAARAGSIFISHLADAGVITAFNICATVPGIEPMAWCILGSFSTSSAGESLLRIRAAVTAGAIGQPGYFVPSSVCCFQILLLLRQSAALW